MATATHSQIKATATVYTDTHNRSHHHYRCGWSKIL